MTPRTGRTGYSNRPANSINQFNQPNQPSRATISIRPKSFAPEPVVAAASSTESATGVRQWSAYQSDIFQFIKDPAAGSAVVIAVAGSGKTSTIVEAAKYLPTYPGFSCAFVAFNKSIAEELKTRLPATVRAQTLNAMGYGAWRRYLGDQAATIRLDSNKVRQITQDVIPAQHYGLFSKGMSRLVGIAKAIGLVPRDLDSDQYSGLVEDDDAVWVDIAETYALDIEADLDKPEHVQWLATYARRILTKSIEMAHALIDFDDQLYMPVITGASFWQNDLIFVDEAQDLNRIQRVMLRRALKPRGRLIAVGDPNQAIYGFRGADHTSIDMIKEEFSARELPLTISYRCPVAVVTEAQRWVSHIQASESAKVGSVTHISKFTSTQFAADDVIVCRNTRPLVALAFNLLRDGVACKVRGRDIGAGLVALVKRFKTDNLDQLQQALDAYVARKTSDWINKQKEDLAQRLQDQYDTVVIFIEQLPPDARVADLVSKIESLFTDNGPSVLELCTIHRAKGREWSKVFILDPDLVPSKYAKTPGAKQQEKNLQYVAATRAKSDLVYISSTGFKSKCEAR